MKKGERNEILPFARRFELDHVDGAARVRGRMFYCVEQSYAWSAYIHACITCSTSLLFSIFNRISFESHIRMGEIPNICTPQFQKVPCRGRRSSFAAFEVLLDITGIICISLLGNRV